MGFLFYVVLGLVLGAASAWLTKEAVLLADEVATRLNDQPRSMRYVAVAVFLVDVLTVAAGIAVGLFL